MREDLPRRHKRRRSRLQFATSKSFRCHRGINIFDFGANCVDCRDFLWYSRKYNSRSAKCFPLKCARFSGSAHMGAILAVWQANVSTRALTKTCSRQADAARLTVGGHEIHFNDHSAYCKLKLCSWISSTHAVVNHWIVIAKCSLSKPPKRFVTELCTFHTETQSNQVFGSHLSFIFK